MGRRKGFKKDECLKSVGSDKGAIKQWRGSEEMGGVGGTQALPLRERS